MEPVADARPPGLLVVPANLGGSVQHFYHFLFGYALPFIEHCHPLRATHRFMLRDCGPLNPLLRQLAGFRIQIVSTNIVITSMVGLHPSLGHLPRIIVPGFDDPQSYKRERLLRIRAVVRRLYEPRIAAVAAQHGASASDRLVLVIDRAPPHPFYATAASENAEAGATRRSVPNMAEVHAAIAARHDALLIRLETLSLFEQIYLFSRAWRVVGQHGAGLANMIWARPDAGLVEILPNPRNRPFASIPNASYFRDLCIALGLPWKVVLQDDNHAAVEPDAILAALS